MTGSGGKGTAKVSHCRPGVIDPQDEEVDDEEEMGAAAAAAAAARPLRHYCVRCDQHDNTVVQCSSCKLYFHSHCLMAEGVKEEAGEAGAAVAQGIITCGECRAVAVDEAEEEMVGGVEGVVNGVAQVPGHVTRFTELRCWRFLEEGMGASALATSEARLDRVLPRFSAVLTVAITEMASQHRPGGPVSLLWRIHNRKAHPLTYLATSDGPSYADTYSE